MEHIWSIALGFLAVVLLGPGIPFLVTGIFSTSQPLILIGALLTTAGGWALIAFFISLCFVDRRPRVYLPDHAA